MPRKQKPLADVFLNIPYDPQFQNLYFAFIAGTCAFGLIPRATLEIPVGRRLDRIFQLIQSCSYSVHDLSRVQLDRKAPSTPRFNMPFELGLAVAWERAGKRSHSWFAFEAVDRRLAKSLSDLNGSDPYIHEGTVRGVFRELCNAFVRKSRQPTVAQMFKIYSELKKNTPQVMQNANARSPFEARVFKDLCVIASAAASRFVV